MKKVFLLSLLICGLSPVVFAQQDSIKTCKTKNIKGGKYKLITAVYTDVIPKELLIDIVVKPTNFTKEYMSNVAKRLKTTYCKENYLSVSIFDDKKAQAGWFYDVVVTKGKEDRRRGTYYFDRKNGKDSIAFSTKRGNSIGEVWIDFSEKEDKKKCEIKDDKLKSIKYYTGTVRRISENGLNAGGLIVLISVKPKQINENYLLLLVKKLKLQFCEESYLTVGIFDKKSVAKRFDTNVKEHLEALRADYVLNKAKNEEYLLFSLSPDYYNKPDTRKKITLSNNEKDKKVNTDVIEPLCKILF